MQEERAWQNDHDIQVQRYSKDALNSTSTLHDAALPAIIAFSKHDVGESLVCSPPLTSAANPTCNESAQPPTEDDATLPVSLENHRIHEISQAVSDMTLIPIARLPPEILADIFTILRSIDHPKPSIPLYLGWLAITHVCRRWRHIALHQPTLWVSLITVPFALGTRWTEVFISRTQTLPLKIRMPLKPSRYSLDPAEVAFIRENLWRTEILQIKTSTDAVTAALCTPAPLLYNLCLHVGKRTRTPPLPQPAYLDILNGPAGAPALRELCTNIPSVLPWTSPLLERLEVLIVVQCYGLELKAALDALGKMRVLKRLQLELDPMHLVANGPPALCVVSPAALRVLDLRMDFNTAQLLLKHLELHADIQVRCVLPCHRTSAAKLAAILPVLTASIDARAAPIMRIVVKPCPWYNRPSNVVVDVVAWRTGKADSQPVLNLAITNDRRATFKSGLMPPVLKALASEYLEELVVGNGENNRAWPDALKTLPRLRYLSASGARVLHSLCAAGLPPALTTLCIVGVDFQSCSESGDLALRDALLQILEDRARSDHALVELDMVGCVVDDAFLHRLQCLPGLRVRALSPEGLVWYM
ncbi:hypothetical protein FA95DRAFT_1543473 [Auriscalpium vulgare]|uniref:Uncharacterized protein n=1 Tax=Auriscalpium vulgare TaxID=40419 RepID=A0ACB8RQ30_9AGAM|nr:hypothetical protein FA95DRAFT_1543473 [Auriscalpium vulgare]